MAGPSWLAVAFAAVMIIIAAYSAGRLVAVYRHGLAIEADTDGLHALMGTAMAGMLAPQLSLLPSRAWAVVFGAGAAWFAACAFRARRPSRFSWRCRFPVPHLIECAAMLYMLLSVPGARHGPDMTMPGMGTSSGAPAAFPALAVILALFLVGYILWTTDHLAALARAKSQPAWPATARQPRALVTVPAASRPGHAPGTPSAPASSDAGPGDEDPAPRRMLAPKLGACSKIMMSVTMGYMLILML
jgi:hypothetical protein